MNRGLKIGMRTSLALALVVGIVGVAVSRSDGSGERSASAFVADSRSDSAREAAGAAAPNTAPARTIGGPIVATIAPTLTPPLRDIPAAPPAPAPVERPFEERIRPPVTEGPADSVVQRAQGRGEMPAPAFTFQGVGNPVACAGCTPPDTEGDVGPNHYVEWVNTSYSIFSKTGVQAVGFPKPGNTVFLSLGAHDCATMNAGDPLVLYDQLADRWVLSQFTAPATGPYYQCVAVSTSPDPAGSYCLYPIQTPQYPGPPNNWIFPDYGKIGMWRDAGGTQDGYFFSFAGFPDDLVTFTPAAMALERAKMLACQPAQMAWFDSSNSALTVWNNTQNGTERLLPSDLDGTTLPPSGEPNYFYTPGLAFDTDSIEQWEFHVDWATIANSTFTLGHTISVPPYDQNFNCFVPPSTPSSRDCIPQPGATTNKLDLFLNVSRHRIMYRAAYRNFGSHRSVVFHHAADAGTDHAGLRWYEMRNPEGTPTASQASTYAPDAHHRWMGSMAQDKRANIAIGYSVSSATLNPSIRWAGQLATSLPGGLNTLTEGEASMFPGAGAQTSTASRWGDYSHMAVDPVDDCTFWYINEYYAANSTTDWQTRIGTFEYPNCETPTAVKVQRLSARWRGSAVELSWRTASEVETLGYNLYRSAGAGPSRRVNRTIIGAKRSGEASGTAAYRFVDRNVRRSVSYQYRLQIVDRAGNRSWHSIGSAAS